MDPAREPPASSPPAPAPSGAARTLTPEEKLSGDMLLLTTAAMVVAAMLWLAIYWSMGYQYSTAIPLLFQALSVVTMGLYLRYRTLRQFAIIQLALILFTPFAMQWSIGNFVTASGVSLWGLMAPVGAITVLGNRESTPWFFGWLFMTVLAGVFDFLLAGSAQRVDLQTVAVFFVNRLISAVLSRTRKMIMMPIGRSIMRWAPWTRCPRSYGPWKGGHGSSSNPGGVWIPV